MDGSRKSPPTIRARLTNTRVWIVDPIDGTKALVNRMPEFCISAALVERGVPVVAAILNPSTDELYHRGARRRTVLERRMRHSLARS